MSFEDKVRIFLSALLKPYEDDGEGAVIDINETDLTEDITAMLRALHYFTNATTGEKGNFIEFTHLLNKLAIQYSYKE